MDDFSISSLSESKNEWCARLLNILTPSIVQGIKSIFDEAWKLCKDNDELDKYLMTFQNFLTRVPKWNQTIIDTEKTRIIETSGCTYLEDLITCVHIVQLKALTCVRVGSNQKKIDIDVPSVGDFIHKIYIHVARKLYTNIYLFDKNIEPLQVQKNNREIEIIVQECILNSIRDSIPLEHLLRAYMDETDEQDVQVSEVEEPLPEKPISTQEVSNDEKKEEKSIDENKNNNENNKSETSISIKEAIEDIKKTTSFSKEDTKDEDGNDKIKLSFSDNDEFVDTKGNTGIINSPKDEKNLEELEKARELERANMADDEDEDDERLVIGDNVKLDILDINDLDKASSKIDLKPPVLDFEVLT